MKTASCKGKGRRLQDRVRDTLRELGKPYGLQDGDIRSAPMGTNGVDVVLSPAAQKVFNLSVECKNQEAITDLTAFTEHYQKYRGDQTTKVYFRSKNHLKSKLDDDAVVMMRFCDFAELLRVYVESKK